MANHGAFSNPGIQVRGEGKGAEHGFRRCLVDGLNKVLFRLRRRLVGRLSGISLLMSITCDQAFFFFFGESAKVLASQQTVMRGVSSAKLN